jgi:hypothetical protein
MPNEGNRLDEAMEAALGKLRPALSRADPVAAAYAAGQASGQRGLNRWRAVAAIAAVIGVGGQWRWPGPRPGRPLTAAAVVVGQPAPLPNLPAALRRDDVVRVEQALLDHGLDGLPPAPRRPVFQDRPFSF